jgi:hypothetical protein
MRSPVEMAPLLRLVVSQTPTGLLRSRRGVRVESFVSMSRSRGDLLERAAGMG